MSYNLLLLQLSFERAGKVEGECALVGFEKWIEIQSFGYKLSSEKKKLAELDEKFQGLKDPDRDSPRDASQLISEDQARRDRFKAAREMLQARMAPAAATPAKSIVRCSLTEVGFTKRFDSASPSLLKGFAAQDVVSEATIVVLTRNDEGSSVKMVPVAKFIMKKSTLTEVKLDLSASDKAATVMDTVTIDTPQLAVEVYRGGGNSGAMRFAYPVR